MMWLELLVEAEIVKQEKMTELIDETDQLLRITVTSIKNTKRKTNKSKRT